MEEIRSQDQEEERVARLLGSLPDVEAPENFEAMVCSRMAERRPSSSLGRPFFWLAVKFAAPMLLLVSLGFFLVLSDDSSLNVGMVPPVDAPAVASPDLGADEPLNSAAVNALNPSSRSPMNRNIGQPETGQPSRDMAVSPDDTTMFPPGVDPRTAVPTDQKPPDGGHISVLAVLGMLGIEAACSNAGCTAVSIQPNSVASRIGLEQGDLIEAVDDRRIGSGVSFGGNVSVSSLRIVRSGKRSTLVLGAR